MLGLYLGLRSVSRHCSFAEFSVVPPQIYIFYGTRSNAEFVIHNGFFYEDNAHDRVKIKLGISKSERLYAMKAEVLARAGIPAYVALVFFCSVKNIVFLQTICSIAKKKK